MSKPLTDAELRELMSAHEPKRHPGSAWMIDVKCYRAASDALWQREVLRKTRERLRDVLASGFCPGHNGQIHNAIEDIDAVLGRTT